MVAKRLPVALRDMAELHSSLALLLVGVALALAVALHAIDVPERVRRAARILMVVLVAQAAVGYTQYFTHLPAGAGRGARARGHRAGHRHRRSSCWPRPTTPPRPHARCAGADLAHPPAPAARECRRRRLITSYRCPFAGLAPIV